MKFVSDLNKFIEFRKTHLCHSMSISYDPEPLYISKAQGVTLYDQDGKPHLDCINNVSHIGHCNAYYIEKMTSQLNVLLTNSRFLYDPLHNVLEKLLRRFPPELCVVTFANAGSEANDLAIQMARIHTGNHNIVCLDGAYHGHTDLCMQVSPYKWNENYKQPTSTIIVDSPCTYRGKYRDQPDQSSVLYAQDYAKQLNGGKVAAFIAEPMQSCAGQIIPYKDYFKEMIKVTKEHGGVFIADEVQTGFARIGSHFWAFEHFGILPDIVCVGKAMGNGFPVSAVITTKEVAASYHKRGIEYFNTYGANPLACVAAEAVLDVIEQSDLQNNALVVGKYLTENLQQFLQYDFVGDLRGQGLFQGIDIVQSKETRTPNPEVANRIKALMRKESVLISTDGVHRNVIKFKPPIVFSKENVDQLISALKKVLKQVSEEVKV